MKKTKIICTIGPATESKEVLAKMIESGMDVARINMSHASHDQAKEITNNIRDLNKELNKNVGILIDTKGPELFVKTYQSKDIILAAGDQIILTTKETNGADNRLLVSYPNITKDVIKGDRILLKDGAIEFVIIDETSDDVICEVKLGGTIKNNMGINIPNVNLNIDFLTAEDKDDIIFASSIDADYLALSFVRSANDILDVNDMLISLQNDHMQIISKIENQNALDDLDGIIKASEGIMVARGDLGVETSFEDVPHLQKKIIRASLLANKICIVATQMLASMETSLKPTRAEVSDVANAVIDGVDAVMLSGETAIGQYPVQTIETMQKIIANMEDNLDCGAFLSNKAIPDSCDTTTIIASNVVNSSNKLKAAAIVASTMSGYTAKMISSFRPNCPIIVTTPNEKTARSLAINYGTVPIVVPLLDSTDEIVANGLLEAKRIISLKDQPIVITGSFPVEANCTNFMKIERIS